MRVFGIGNLLAKNDVIFNEGDGINVAIPFGISTDFPSAPVLNEIVENHAFLNVGNGIVADGSHGAVFEDNKSHFNGVGADKYDLFDSNGKCAKFDFQLPMLNKWDGNRANIARSKPRCTTF